MLPAALGLAAGLLPQAAAAEAQVYALTVGGDAYVGLKALGGAANDARLLADTFERAGAREVVMLIGREATRANIFAVFETLATKAQAGDWIIFTYAGHGGQEPESLPGDEADGRDEVMLLPGYMNQPPQNAERIRDNDIYALFASVRPDVSILFVADACHGGSMTRSIDPRAREAVTRFADYGPINDALAPPPGASQGRAPQELPNVVFAAASLDTEAAPELRIEGRMHGALSFHIARAIRGAADLDRDGRITLGEFRRYVVSATRLASESRQTPDVRFLASRTSEALPFGRMSTASVPSAPVLTVDAGGASLPPDVPSSGAGSGDFIWDPATGAVVNNGTGDLVATVSNQDALGSAIEKWRVLPQLKALAAQGPLETSVAPRGAGVRYRDGENVEIVLAPRAGFGPAFLTVVNLASDGTVQWLFPSVRQPFEAEAVSLDQSRRFTVRAGAPFGADHVIAIATEMPQSRCGRSSSRWKACGRPAQQQRLSAPLFPRMLMDSASLAFTPECNSRQGRYASGDPLRSQWAR